MSTGGVKKVVDRHRTRLVALERTFSAANRARSDDVTQAYAQGGTSTPPASADVLNAARAWRTEARYAYGEIQALDPRVSWRQDALNTYATLNNGIYHLQKALAAGPDIARQYDQAVRNLTDFKKRYAKLLGEIR